MRKYIKGVFDAIKKNIKDKNKRLATSRANEVVQICEHEGSLWFRYNGKPLFPMAYFNEKPIDVIREIRKIHLAEQEGIQD